MDYNKVPYTEELEAYGQTCAWILPDIQEDKNYNSPRSIFGTWLTSNEPLLWISGKAGCGKSTLMRYLHQKQLKDKLFSTWLKDEALTVAAFFFFERGGELQKSRQGMLRSLLHQILSTERALIRRVFPKEFETHSSLPPSFLDWVCLRTAFEQALQDYTDRGKSVILFIDGLDEYRDLKHSNKYTEEDFDLIYDGPNEDARWGISKWISAGHREIAEILQSFKKGGSVKMIISSRELTTFDQAFGSATRVRVHEYTEPAIREYCHGRLKPLEPETSSLVDVSKLVDEIASRSSGVFLWVQLVVGMLMEGIADGDEGLELLALLHDLPDRLGGKHGLYSRMLRRIKRTHLREASRLFRLALDAHASVHIFQLFFAAEGYLSPKGELLATGGTIGPYDGPSRKLDSELEAKQKRLKSRCAGLLEVVSTTQHVQFMHHTTKEFMSRDDIWDWDCVFGHDIDADVFNPSLALLSGYIRYLKLDPSEPGMQSLIAASHIHAADEKSQDKASYVLLVDELDRVCGPICEVLGIRSSVGFVHGNPLFALVRPEQWYLLLDPNRCNWPPRVDNFLSYAAWRGLATYLDEKLKGQDISLRKTIAESLLSSVMTTWEDRARLASPLEIMQPPVLEVLLRHGASPNTRTYRKAFDCKPSEAKKAAYSTVWADILESGFVSSKALASTGYRFRDGPLEWRTGIAQQVHSFRRVSREDYSDMSYLDLAWTKAVVLLLQHGADTNAQFEIAVWPDRYDRQFESTIMTPIEMIRACISGKSWIADGFREIEDLVKAVEGGQNLSDFSGQPAFSLPDLSHKRARYSADLKPFQLARFSDRDYCATLGEGSFFRSDISE